MEKLTLLERFSNPELLKGMTIGDKLMASLYVTALGMAVTFIALLIIWVLIILMTKFTGQDQSKKKIIAQ